MMIRGAMGSEGECGGCEYDGSLTKVLRQDRGGAIDYLPRLVRHDAAARINNDIRQVIWEICMCKANVLNITFDN